MDSRVRFSGKALLVTVFWGLSFVASRVALEVFTPIGLVAARTVIGCAALFAVTRGLGYALTPPAGDRGRCLLLGLILAAHLLIQSAGLLMTTATNTGWIIGFVPITIALG